MAPGNDTHSITNSDTTLVGTSRDTDRLPERQRDVASLEREMLDAAEGESRKIVATARAQVHDIVLQARRDLMVLRVQMAAAREHLRGARGPTSQAVRELHESVRPDMHALEDETSATTAMLEDYRNEATAAPLGQVREPERPDIEVVPEAEPALRRSPWRYMALAIVCVGILGAAATMWMRQQPGIRNSPPRAPAAPTTSAAASPTPDTASPRAAAAAHGVHLAVRAQRAVWVRINVDGRADTGRTLAAGERRDIDGEHVSVRAGDAGALLVSANGEPFAALGRDGFPLTRDFGDVNTVRAAAAPLPAGETSPQRPLPAQPVVAPPTADSVVPAPAPRAATSIVPATPVPAAAQSATSPTTPAGARGAAPAASADHAEIVRASEAWLMAFFRHDESGMTRAGGGTAAVDDQRQASDQSPPGFEPRRSLEQEDVQFVGATALFTGRLVETPQGGGTPLVSLVSQLWTRDGNTWRILNARIVPEARVRDAVR
jgi:hypothetical protein